MNDMAIGGAASTIDRNRELEGKVAIITGSARNIGRSMAEELARAGATVVINAVNAKDLCEEVAHGIEQAGGKALPILADITKQEDVDRMVEQTVKELGGLDILINNAAIRSRAHFTKLKFEDWEKLREVALDGGLRTSLAAVPHIIKRGGGSIIGIHGMTSYSGLSPEGAHKAAVKTGMAGMIRGMAYDLGEYNITCNAAVVGRFDTDRAAGSGDPRDWTKDTSVPMQRKGVPQDMADLVRFLVGPFARYISGQTIHVNGAAYMPH